MNIDFDEVQKAMEDTVRDAFDYFLERFVTGLTGITIKDEQKLEAEFRMLAENVDSFPKAIVHRDFQ